MGNIAELIGQVSTAFWGPPMLILLVGSHIFLTFKTKFIQRHVGKAIRLSVSKDSASEGDISQFAALSTALAATIGTGNIVGVATAITLGGPGAVFWCWITGILGMATKYGEGLLAVKYRVKTSDGTMLGGPMYALERGMGAKWLAVLFAFFAALASFGIGSATQSNSLTSVISEQVNIAPWVISLIASLAAALVIIGGVKSISKVCAFLVPVMTIFYVAGCIIIMGVNRIYLGEAISVIVKTAFSGRALAGGFTGGSFLLAARYGIARGLFTNESGMGSAPIAAAAAQTRNPVRQALVSMTGPFWDTVVVCAITGIAVVSTMIRYPALTRGLEGSSLSSAVFGTVGNAGTIFLMVGLTTFAFSTILGWSYYGERCVEYLFGKRGITPYKALYIAACFFGGVMPLGLVWDLSDILNGIMTLPNLISLIFLSGTIVSETRKYLWDNRLDEMSNERIPTIPDHAKK